MTKSFGIILFIEYDDTPVKYLIYQRRDSNAFIKLIRKLGNDNPLELATGLTLEEKNRLRNYSFDEIWDDLFVNHSCRCYHVERRRASSNYFNLKKTGIIDKITAVEGDTPLSWGFPKGRIDSRDNNEIECAYREFREETGMPTDDLELPLHLDCYEYKIADDYFAKFYPAKTNVMYEIKYKKVEGRIRDTYVTDESNDLKWVTVEEAKNYLESPHIDFLIDLDKKIKSGDKTINLD